jgi:DNA-binding MarR family transcriptional regulator
MPLQPKHDLETKTRAKRTPRIDTSRPPAIPEAGVGKRGTQGHIAYLLRQAHNAVRNSLDLALAELDLTTPQFLVLNLLNAYSGASGADVARIAQLTPQTVNQIVQRLERDGLIERVQHETHGRVLRLALTDIGSDKLRLCKRLADVQERRLLGLMKPGAEQALRHWLSEVAMVMTKNNES